MLKATAAPKEKKNDFEKFFGINLLPKIGIATLVLGIAYFVKYAIDRNWINETGRVAIGILAGAALIGVAHRLRNNYRAFSSILVGGGIAALYFTIAIAFWEYHLFSQTVAFVLLIFITAISVFLSIIYDKIELIIFSQLGGFAAPLIVSTGTGNYVVLFSYLLILNTAMLIVAFKKNWRIISVIAYVLTLIFYWAWLFNSFEEQYMGATLFGVLFFIQFYLVAMIDYYKSTVRKITPFQAAVILINNLWLFFAGLYIFHDNPVSIKGIVTISLAVLNVPALYVVAKEKVLNKHMLYLLVAVVLSFVSLAAPMQLDGTAITMFWAAETVILLLLFRQSDINIFKSGYLILQPVVLIALQMDWMKFYFAEPHAYTHIGAGVTGLTVLASVWLNRWLIKKYAIEFVLSNNKIDMYSILKVTSVLLLFFVPCLELYHQLHIRSFSGNFIALSLGTYFYLFLAGYSFFSPQQPQWTRPLYIISLVAALFYVIAYLPVVVNVRDNIEHWMLHWLTLPAIVIIFRYLCRNVSYVSISPTNNSWIFWVVAALSVFIVNVEADSMLLMLFRGRIPDAEVLSYSRTIAYPVLWGIGAFVLMTLGMKSKKRDLRVIALVLFALIILKLYLHDVWEMSQIGRIVAFIFLGLLLLSVSFLYQKLKILFQKDEA